METIKNYLETMFSALPNTNQVHKAKAELYGMMEDKFDALVKEGSTEEDAIAKVISEFGSLSEIADELGIADAVDTAEERPRRNISGDEIDAFLKEAKKTVGLFSFAAFLIVASFAGREIVRIISDYLSGSYHFSGELLASAGIVAVFALIAIGTGMIIMAYTGIRKWEYMFSEPAQLDFPTLSRIDEQFQSKYHGFSMGLAVGVGLCIVSILPPFLFRGFYWSRMGNIYSAAFWIIAAIGVALIISSEGQKRAYLKLLSLNGKDTVGGNQFFSQKQLYYNEPVVDAIMSMYWQTVMCLYLSWSFLTFSWMTTWIIWPVAAIINLLIRQVFGREERQ